MEPNPTDQQPNQHDLTSIEMRARQRDFARADEANERAKKNHDFVQLQRATTDVLSLLGAKHGLALAIFVFMIGRMQRDNSIAVSRDSLAHFLQVGKSSVSNAMKILVEHNIISTKKIGRSNVYLLNAYVTWSTHNNLKYCAGFKKTVFLDPSDQARLNEIQCQKIVTYTLPSE